MLDQAPVYGFTIPVFGKGIVYDTGGLSLKGKEHMPGMKGDMGGATAVLGAFAAAARTTSDTAIVAALCLAENSVGPDATRPDDILHLYSGKTVEVNNTDAEGRLVLGDGVAWMSRHENCDELWDLATLTGAALMTTGKVHCGVYTADEGLERRALSAGLASGDPCFPHIHAPELMRKEFKSQVADLKNSVKDRMKAQSSCAANFIYENLKNSRDNVFYIGLIRSYFFQNYIVELLFGYPHACKIRFKLQNSK